MNQEASKAVPGFTMPEQVPNGLSNVIYVMPLKKPFVSSRPQAKEPLLIPSTGDGEEEQADYMSGGLLDLMKQEDAKKQRGKKAAALPQPKKHSEMREEALATPIGDSNIGFKLLKQMGYK